MKQCLVILHTCLIESDFSESAWLSTTDVPQQRINCFHVHKTNQLPSCLPAGVQVRFYLFIYFLLLLLFVWVVQQIVGLTKKEIGSLSSITNVISSDTTSNLVHIKQEFFMKAGRWALHETRCKMSLAHRCQGCAITFRPSCTRKDCIQHIEIQLARVATSVIRCFVICLISRSLSKLTALFRLSTAHLMQIPST